MTPINQILLKHDSLRAYIWNIIGIDPDIRLPMLPTDMLYGSVSDLMHSPTFQYILISNHMPKDLVAFYDAVAKAYKRSLQVYSEEDAAGYSHEDD